MSFTHHASFIHALIRNIKYIKQRAKSFYSHKPSAVTFIGINNCLVQQRTTGRYAGKTVRVMGE